MASKRGTIRFVGKIPELGAGYWVGIELDEATGECDGSVQGKTIFTCAPLKG